MLANALIINIFIIRHMNSGRGGSTILCSNPCKGEEEEEYAKHKSRKLVGSPKEKALFHRGVVSSSNKYILSSESPSVCDDCAGTDTVDAQAARAAAQKALAPSPTMTEAQRPSSVVALPQEYVRNCSRPHNRVQAQRRPATGLLPAAPTRGDDCNGPHMAGHALHPVDGASAGAEPQGVCPMPLSLCACVCLHLLVYPSAAVNAFLCSGNLWGVTDHL